MLDSYIRKASKYMARCKNETDKQDDPDKRRQWLIDVFHTIKTAMILLHPIAPSGTEGVRDYLMLDESVWDWEHIFDTFAELLPNETEHKLKFLEPRVDFFTRHESQFENNG